MQRPRHFSFRKTPAIQIMLSLALMIGAVGTAYEGSARAQASASQAITMSPASTQISVKPGGTIKKSFDVINGGDDAYNIAVSAEPYSVAGINYDPQFKQLPGTANVTSWVTFDTKNQSAEPRTVKTINYTVTVPAATAPGGYYAVLFAESSPLIETSDSGVVPHNRVGNILYITVEGEVKTGGDLTAAPLKGFSMQTPIAVGVNVRNTGGVHFISKVNIIIKNARGQKVHEANMERFVLPNTERLVSDNWRPSSPVDIYTVSRSATVAGEVKVLPDKRVVYVQPWVILAALVIIGLIVILIIVVVQKRKKNSKNKAAAS